MLAAIWTIMKLAWSIVWRGWLIAFLIAFLLCLIDNAVNTFDLDGGIGFGDILWTIFYAAVALLIMALLVLSLLPIVIALF